VPERSEIDTVLDDIRAERLARRSSRAETFGPRGFGHTQDRMQLVEDEAAAIRDAARRVLDGETLSSVVQDWNRRGLISTTGGPWRVNSLSALLIQPRLAGLHVNGGGEFVPKWPPIVERATHERLAALRASRGVERRSPRRSLLNGMLRCGRCDGNLHFLHRSETNEYYRCPAPAAGGCSGVIVKARLAEDQVRDLVVARIDTDEFAVAAEGAGAVRAADDVRSLAAQIDADTARLKELARLWGDRAITRAEWQSARADIARRLEAGDATLAQIESERSVLRLAGEGRRLASRWSAMTSEERRQIIVTALDHVIVDPVGGMGGRFQPSRMRPVWRSP